MQVSSVGRTAVKEIWGAGSGPVLEIIPDSDPFKPASVGESYASSWALA